MPPKINLKGGILTMAKISPLFSSSSGNSTYIETQNGGILVDVGVSFKSLNEALLAAGGSFKKIKAIAITHEHIDHIKCLKTLLKKHNIPVIASAKTLEALERNDSFPSGAALRPIEENTEISGTQIVRFATSHDCEGSSGYKVLLPDGSSVAVCTDLGVMTDTVREALLGCETILIESNHDVDMLKKGPYPPELKLRIMSDKGHLSNSACAVELGNFLKNGTKRFILGHLSQHNNLPTIALSASKAALMDKGAVFGEDYLLYVAKPSKNEVIYI